MLYRIATTAAQLEKTLISNQFNQLCQPFSFVGLLTILKLIPCCTIFVEQARVFRPQLKRDGGLDQLEGFQNEAVLIF